MAGYMTRLNGYVYDGHHVAAAAIANGVFATLDANNKVAALSAANANLKMKVAELTTLFGLPAVRLDVVINNTTAPIYFVENEYDIRDNANYDESTFTTAAGKLVKMHAPVVGDQLIMSVTAEVLATLAVGDIVNPTTGGTIVKST